MATGVLENVVLAFSSQLIELLQATLLRVDGETAALCREDLARLEAQLRDVEGKVREIKALLAQERGAIPAARAIVQACTLQQRQLEHIQSRMPTYLPSLAQPLHVKSDHGPNPTAVKAGVEDNIPNQNHGRENQPPQHQAPAAPRYISSVELESLSSYMRARLTADRVNAALEELHRYAERNAVLIVAARKGRVSNAEKKHAMWLAYDVGAKEELHGRQWALESDLKSGTALRLDKTGRSIITVLRHLGRISETRINVDGSMISVLLLNTA